MADLDILQVAEALSRVQVNYSNLAQSWYDIFYNTTPMDVPLEFYDAGGVNHTYIIPNRAKDQKYIMNGVGSPEGVLIADVGTVYQDIQLGTLYVKLNNTGENIGWVNIISQADLDKFIIRGAGEPEGRITAGVGTMFVREDLVNRGNNDKVGGYLYMKRTSTGNTGWERIDSFPSSLLKEVFYYRRNVNDTSLYDIYSNGAKVRTGTDGTIIPLDGTCENVGLISVFMDGVLVAPEEYTLLNDLKTIQLKKPINIVSTELSLQIIVQYFIDVHVNESSAQQEIVELNKDVHNYLYGDVDELINPFGDIPRWEDLPEKYKVSIYTYWLNVKDKSLDIQGQIDKIDEYGDQVIEDIRRYAYGDITPTEEQLKKGILKVLQDYVDEVQVEWDQKYADMNKVYLEIIEMSNTAKANAIECQNWYNKNYELDQHMQANKDFIEREYEKGNMTLKTEPYTNLVSAPWYAHLQTQITDNETDIENKVSTLDQTLSQRIVDKEVEIKDYVDSQDTVLSDTISAHKTILDSTKGALDDLTNQFNTVDVTYFKNEANPYFNKDNFPINKNGIFKFSEEAGVENGTEIKVIVNKDVSYYNIDLGAKMTAKDDLGAILGDTKFTFNISYDAETAAIKHRGENLVTVIRVFLKNNTQYLPEIDWSPSNITWLDSEVKIVPEKNYMIELISYDFMEGWLARAFVCQPPVVVDGIIVHLSITCPAITDLAGFETKDVEVYGTIGTDTNIYLGTYKFDGATKQINIDKEFERGYENEDLTNLSIRTTDMPIFHKYSDELVHEMVEGAHYNIECTKASVTQHDFTLGIKSTILEQYMVKNSLDTINISAKVEFASGEKVSENITYTYNPKDVFNGGATIVYGNEILGEAGASEKDDISNNFIKRIKIRYAELPAGECIANTIGEEFSNIEVFIDASQTVSVENEGQTW